MTPGTHLRDLWRFRELFRSLAVRNLKVKYQRSVLGFLWTLVNPLLTILALGLVFTHVVRIALPDYWAFLLSGYFVWNFASQMFNTATYVLAEHGPLRRSVRFPTVVPLLAAAASRFVEFAVELALAVVALAVAHHHGVPAAWTLLPLLLLLMLLLVLGLALPVATLAAFYVDVQHVLPIVLLVLFYASPVFYPAHMVPASVQDLYFLNPLAGLLTLFQTVLYEGRFPEPGLLAGIAAASGALFVLGYAVFHRYDALYAELA